jgi:hypothetical protein
MRAFLPALLLATALLLPAPVAAVEMDDKTELLIRCGAGYLLVADDDELMGSEQEAEKVRGLGMMLLEQADAILTAAGVGGDEREQAGADLATEVAAAFASDTDPGFESTQCLALLEAAEKPEPEAPDASAAAQSEEIDKLMTCGAGFYVTSEAAREDGDDDTARNLGSLAETLIGRGEELMIEAGMGDDERFQVSKLYGQQVAERIYAGEDLAYDWDTCAALAY